MDNNMPDNITVLNDPGEIQGVDFSEIDNISFEDIDHNDYPDYCDAHISNCDISGMEATEEELEEINEDKDFVYEKLMIHLY